MNNISYKDIIEEKGMYVATPIGKSMWPMLRNRVDTVKLVKPITLKKYDVILYLRKNGQYVLHRIIKVRKNDFILSGDNQWQKEPGITQDMIIGVVDGFYRKEKYIKNNNFLYKMYYHFWTRIKFIKKFIFILKRLIKKIFRPKGKQGSSDE